MASSFTLSFQGTANLIRAACLAPPFPAANQLCVAFGHASFLFRWKTYHSLSKHLLSPYAGSPHQIASSALPLSLSLAPEAALRRTASHLHSEQDAKWSFSSFAPYRFLSSSEPTRCSSSFQEAVMPTGWHSLVLLSCSCYSKNCRVDGWNNTLLFSQTPVSLFWLMWFLV